MSTQILYLFANQEKRSIANEVLNQRLQQANLSDYATIDLDAPPARELYCHYAINTAFQQQTVQGLLHSIELLKGTHHLDMKESEFENQESYHAYLEEVFIAALEMGKYCDTVEIGYAEKFDSIIWT